MVSRSKRYRGRGYSESIIPGATGWPKRKTLVLVIAMTTVANAVTAGSAAMINGEAEMAMVPMLLVTSDP